MFGVAVVAYKAGSTNVPEPATPVFLTGFASQALASAAVTAISALADTNFKVKATSFQIS